MFKKFRFNFIPKNSESPQILKINSKKYEFVFTRKNCNFWEHFCILEGIIAGENFVFRGKFFKEKIFRNDFNMIPFSRFQLDKGFNFLLAGKK